MARPLILASESPRRRALLAQLGAEFTVRPAHIDEARHRGEPPQDYVVRMARVKATTGGAVDECAVLAADTSVVLGDKVLGKPTNRAEAAAMLQQLSGRSHSVHTAVCIALPGRCLETRVATRVDFAALTAALIDSYLATDEPWDKAGAYALQGIGGVFVRAISGSVSNVIGLPLWETLELLRAAGVATNPGGADAARWRAEQSGGVFL